MPGNPSEELARLKATRPMLGGSDHLNLSRYMDYADRLEAALAAAVEREGKLREALERIEWVTPATVEQVVEQVENWDAVTLVSALLHVHRLARRALGTTEEGGDVDG